MKSYKILRISGKHYSTSFESWLQKNPDFYNSSYDKMLKQFFNSKIMYSDGFYRSFHELGQEAYEIIADCNIVQKQWARENGIKFDSRDWMINILMAQISKIKPEVIYFQGTEWCVPGRFSPERAFDNLIKILKETYPFIKKVLIFSGYPSGAERIKGADIFFSSPPSILDNYRKQGLNPILLYHSFDDAILSKLNGGTKKYGFTFTGTSRAPESRYWALRELIDKTNLEAWIYEPHKIIGKKQPFVDKSKYYVKSSIKYFLGLINPNMLNKYLDKYRSSNYLLKKLRNTIIEQQTIHSMYPEKCHEPIMGIDMYNLLHQSKLTFNNHADKAWGCVGNMRMFEATGVGTCLITDTGYNMKDLYEPDKEVVTYSGIDEAVEKVNYLIDHPDEAEKIAKAGQARTLKDHTIMNRCQQIDEVIQKKL